MKTAIVYDRVNKWGGAERVLLALHDIFPDAPLYTSVYDPDGAPWARIFPEIIPSFLQEIPFAKSNHEYLGFLTPFAFESFNFDGFDLVITVTSEAAKGIITKPSTLHLCYCLTPTRYLWSGYDEYLKNIPSKFAWIPFYSTFAKPLLAFVKMWDRVASQRPDVYLAISEAVKERIKKYYNRDADIIYPPVDLKKFNSLNNQKNPRKDYYLFVSRLIPYKKPEMVVKAFNILGKKLVIVGKGSEGKKLKKIAHKNIRFIDYLSDHELAKYYSSAKALVFPGEEDFGIVMAEAIASGTPVIAYAKGGSKDIITDGKNGILFNGQSVESLIAAVKSSESKTFDKSYMAKSVQKFSYDNFRKNLLSKLTTLGMDL